MQSDSIICTNKVFPNKLLAENLAYFWLMHGVSAQKNKQKKKKPGNWTSRGQKKKLQA